MGWRGIHRFGPGRAFERALRDAGASMAALLPYRRFISALWPKCFRGKVRVCARWLAIDPPCLFADLANQPESPDRVMRGISSRLFHSISSLRTAIPLLHAKHFSHCLPALDFFQSKV